MTTPKLFENTIYCLFYIYIYHTYMYIFNVIFSQPINLFFNDKNRI